MTRTEFETEYVRRHWNVIRKFQDRQAASQLLVGHTFPMGSVFGREFQEQYDIANTNLEAAMHQLAEWVWEMANDTRGQRGRIEK